MNLTTEFKLLRQYPGLTETSIVISLIRFVSKWQNQINQKIRCIYEDSRFYKHIQQLREKIKNCFRYSLCGRMLSLEQIDAGTWTNSYAVRFFMPFFKSCKDRMTNCLHRSLTAVIMKDTQKQFYYSFVKMLWIVLLTAVITNLIFSFILHKQISLIGWLIRGLFLVVFIPGLFCKADWAAVKNSSAFLKMQGGFEKQS